MTITALGWSYQKNVVFVQKCFSPFIYLFIYLFINLYYCFFMTCAGRYAPALRNDTLHGHTAMESTVHIYVL